MCVVVLLYVVCFVCTCVRACVCVCACKVTSFMFICDTSVIITGAVEADWVGHCCIQHIRYAAIVRVWAVHEKLWVRRHSTGTQLLIINKYLVSLLLKASSTILYAALLLYLHNGDQNQVWVVEVLCVYSWLQQSTTLATILQIC